MTLLSRQKRAVRVMAAIGALAFVSAVTACAQGESMSPQESRDKLVTLINDTAAIISTEGWDETGAPIGSCSSASGKGVNASWGGWRANLWQTISATRRKSPTSGSQKGWTSSFRRNRLSSFTRAERASTRCLSRQSLACTPSMARRSASPAPPMTSRTRTRLNEHLVQH